MEIQETVIDITSLCRLCLTQETVMSSISNDQESHSVPLPLRIMACVSIDVRSTDCLSNQICSTCLWQVDGWYKFKDLCTTADAILKQYLQNEPVHLESITQVQEMAREWKNSYTEKPQERLEIDIVTPVLLDTQKKPQKAKTRPLGKSNGDEKQLYNYLKIELKHEGYPDDMDANNTMSDVENEILDTKSREIFFAMDEDKDFSSDDSLTPLINIKKKTLHTTRRNNKTKKSSNNGCKIQKKKAIKKESTKVSRTMQTQTGTEDSDEFKPEIIECTVGEQAEEKKRIKSIKTQTPKEKFPAKKRVRVRPAVPSACTLCDKIYKNSEILRQHMKSHHVTGTIECSMCKMTFPSLRSLKYHEQRKHSNLEPVPCSICGKKFLDKKYLKIHENIHSQNNPFVCQFCGRKFIMKTNLTVHISRHHSLKSNDFICQVCGKAFPFKLYLKKHFKTHTDYKPHACSYCDAKFREKTLLKKHVDSIHLKLRPFLCQYCHKTFTRSLYLREHMESQHLGIQKKIECARCGEMFQSRNRLRQHECEGRVEVQL